MKQTTQNADVPASEARAATPSTPGPEFLPAQFSEAEGQQVVAALQSLLDGRWADTRAEVRKTINNPLFRQNHSRPIAEYREHILTALSAAKESGIPAGAFTTASGGTGNTGATLTAFEMFGHGDLSIMVKSGVQWGLFGGAIDNLGTERHRELAKKALNLEVLGCFGMTELGHGSDVQNLETTLTYDAAAQEFVVHSPSASAKKVYIGNAARHGQMAVVFGQLFTPDSEESKGVHAIVVPIRDDSGSSPTGVTIGDHGHKGGLPGVDNGTLLFDHVRVPRENLLDRFAQVAADGTYSSSIDSHNRRFFTMLGTLVRGRVSVGAAAGAATRSALTVALRYATKRRQFEGVPGKEKRLIEHRAHRLRLLAPLARTYALALAQNEVIEQLHEQNKAIATGEWDLANPTKEQAIAQRKMEALAASVKVAATAHATRTIQECREACGGAGYMEENLLTSWKADSDVFTTFEGDNTVLLQLVGKEEITAFAREMGNLDPMELIRFGVQDVSDALRKTTGLRSNIQRLIDNVTDRDERDIFNPGYQMALLEQRHSSLLKSLARRLRAAKKAEIGEAVRIVDKAQDHLIAVAEASIDRMLMQSMLDAEQKIEDAVEQGRAPEGARKVFEQIRDVFALSLINQHAAWFQEQHILPGTRTKAARAALNDLVDSLGPWSNVLVDAFAVPPVLVDAPMLHDAGIDGE